MDAGDKNVVQESRVSEAAEVSARDRAATLADNLGGTMGARPSNTAPYNCNAEDNTAFFQALRWGVYSLYLSYRGKLSQESEVTLRRLKELAVSERPSDKAVAQLEIGKHIFEVKDRGAKRFLYILEDKAFRIQLSKAPSKTFPVAYVKISSHYLTCHTPAEIERELSEILGSLTVELERPNVSRIDLFADFLSSVDMDSWEREAWVTLADSINNYSAGGSFTGWTIGVGGSISCRLYDKLIEVVTVSRKDYLFPLWKKAGWDGNQHVWRLEFQFENEAISQLGLKGFNVVLNGLGGMWGYAVTECLRLTVPNPSDATRSRWPVHPLWSLLASIDWEREGGPLHRTFPASRQPGHDWLMTHGLSALTSFMAAQCIYNFEEGIAAFGAELAHYHDEKAFLFGQSLSGYVWDKVALKVRQYGAAMNADALTPEAKKEKRLDAAAEAYRKASDGE